MGEQGDRALAGGRGTLIRMAKGKREAGSGQLDVILDGVGDVDERVVLDRLVGVEVVHKCEMCGHKISADESRAFGIGYDCAAELGRKVWAAERERRAAAEAQEQIGGAA